MSKRRVFDIEFPDEPVAPSSGDVPAGTDEPRRGPMATAIAENAGALKERSQAEAAIRAENDRLAHEHVRLKKLGLITDLVPVDSISMTRLVRDRTPERDAEIDELKKSILAVGLSNPIRVEQHEDGYELIQGFRRLTAFRELYAETQDARFASIPAGLVPRGETIDGLYRRMIDENLVRRDISFAEMGLLVLRYMQDHPEAGDDPLAVSDKLFASASRQKRGHIRTFVRLMTHIGHALRFPEAMPRALGTEILRRIDESEGQGAALVAKLEGQGASCIAEDELAVLRAFSEQRLPKQGAGKPSRSQARTSLKLVRPEGTARCTASDGKLELRLDRDFSAIDRARLEQAISAFFTTLDD